MDEVKKIGMTNLITINKNIIQRVPKFEIPNILNRDSFLHGKYYLEYYVSYRINNETIGINFYDYYKKGYRKIPFPKLIRRGANYVNLCIDQRILNYYHDHKYWKIKNNKDNTLYMIKSNEEEFKKYKSSMI